MSSGLALLLILVVGSTVTSSELFPHLMRMTKRSHLAMAMARSRVGPHETLKIPKFLVNIVQQKWGTSAFQKKKPEEKDRLNERALTELPNYWFKVCSKCPKHTWFLRKLQEEEAVRTEVIMEALLQAVKGGLTPWPNN